MTITRTPYRRQGKTYISITIDPDQCAALDMFVGERQAAEPRATVSRALLIREAIDMYLRIHNRPLHTDPADSLAA